MNDTTRFPIGTFDLEQPFTPDDVQGWLEHIATFPQNLRDALEPLSEEQLDSPYRDGGWKIRQLVHHIADSHMNAYVRFKWALTEDAPTIKAYRQEGWAELPDSTLDVAISLQLLEALHQRWIGLSRQLSPEQWQRTFVHPVLGAMSLEQAAGMYAWHGRHHLEHIKRAFA